jgi:hypothetical protein
MTTSEIVKRLRSFTKGNDALEHEAAARLEALKAENARLRDGLIDMLDLAEMLAGNEGWDTYKARFNSARAALRGET